MRKEDGRRKTEGRKWKTEGCLLKTAYCRLKTITCFISLLFLLSCQDVKRPEVPTNLISKEKMVDILSDVYISNASRNVNNKLIKKMNLKLDSLIYVKYEIDSLQFAESNEFYSADLKTYSNLLTDVQTRLKILKIEKDSLFKIAKKEDSILKIKENKDLKVLTKFKESN